MLLKGSFFIGAVAAVLCATVSCTPPADGAAARFPGGIPLERVNVSAAGVQDDMGSDNPAISADGRYAAFRSISSILVPGDVPGTEDIFIYDRQRDSIELLSVDSIELFGYMVFSADGRYLAFESDADNLVPGDTNGVVDVFVHDRNYNTTERVSVGAGGVQADENCSRPSMSADGRSVVFESITSTLVPGDTNGVRDVFLYDRQNDVLSRMSVNGLGEQGDNDSREAKMSADGRYMIFSSAASNLVSGDTNARRDIFVVPVQ